MSFVTSKIIARKTKNQLHNTDHKVAEGIYVAGTLAGWRSHFLLQPEAPQ
jgi:hypothetical protein